MQIASVSAAGLFALDRITLTLVALIAFVGWIVVRFARTYLQGDPRRAGFFRRLTVVLAAVSVVVATNHLVVLTVAWSVASFALHGLLTHFPDRPAAVAAAHKKFLFARAADLCMVGALVAVHRSVGTWQIDEVVDAVRERGSLDGTLQFAIVLVAVAAVLKCAQLPFHGWLIQVMEAPTPVSALLHAGVVNLGGVVLLRLAPVVDASTPARSLLVVVGTASAVIAALVMTTRVSIKVALAWSTCAQMGFMLVQCGLGLWEMALVHLVAHSLYKAHAFLHSGDTVIETSRSRMTSQPEVSITARTGGLALAAAGAMAVGFASALVPHLELPSAPLWLMLGIVALAVSPLATMGRRGDGAFALGAAVGVPAVYLGLHELAQQVVPTGSPPPAALLAVVALGFATLFTLQTAWQARPDAAVVRRLRPWIYSGLFLDDAVTRVAFTLTPPRRRPPSSSPLPRPTVVLHHGSPAS